MKTLTTPFDGTFALIALFSATVGFILFDTFIALCIAIGATLIQCFITRNAFTQEKAKDIWIKENRVDYLDEKTFSEAVQLAFNNNWELTLESLSLDSPLIPNDADEEDLLTLEMDLKEMIKTQNVDLKKIITLRDVCEKVKESKNNNSTET